MEIESVCRAISKGNKQKTILIYDYVVYFQPNSFHIIVKLSHKCFAALTSLFLPGTNSLYSISSFGTEA